MNHEDGNYASSKWKWIALYIVVAGLVYYGVYYYVAVRGGSGY